jgi:predicted transcriptional regulator
MKLFCEIMVADILPAVRALMSRELSSYGLNQSQISKKLGVTQPAVSQYKKELRGQSVKALEKNKVVMDEIKSFAKRIGSSDVENGQSYDMFCALCGKVRKEKVMMQINKDMSPEILECNLYLK